MRQWLVAGVLFVMACLDVSLPSPPGPGSIAGTVVSFRPGRAQAVPCVGARVSLARTSLSTNAGSTGQFVLEPITVRAGQLSIECDLDQNGSIDRQRVLDLADVRAGPGRDVQLGQVVLGENASVTGRVLRGDVSGAGGHRGTAVLIPEAPYATTTADDGTFLLPDLPAGRAPIAFFRDGYELVVAEAELRAGEEVRLRTVTLVRAPSSTLAGGALVGRVVGVGGAPLEGVSVQASQAGRSGTQLVTGGDGVFRLEALSAGPWDLACTRSDLATLVVRNVLVSGGETDLGTLVMVVGTSTPPRLEPLPGLDAGPPGLVDAGRIDDGGVVAVISPSPVVVALDPQLDGGVASFSVNGDQSVGAPPLQYFWESLSVGEGLVLRARPSDFSSRADFEFSAVVPPGSFRIRLYVRDQLGRESDWQTAEVRAAFRPEAVLAPLVAMVDGGVVELDGTQSQDPGGLPLSHRFRVISGAAMLVPSGAHASVLATAAGAVVVGLEVENSFGLVSAEARATLTFSGAADGG